jgi:very-short-patch-repair endonuclease
MLREHFRCMPEIIKFSNELCYRDEAGRPQLVPLRKFSGKRLEPVLRPVFVAGGNRSGDTNKPEIDAIVDAIAQCIANPEYAEKTFGVVSLLGTQQADAIQRALIQSLGAEEVEKRRIISGNAYAFQGDERDVMFMSLVVATGERNITALTKDADKRRFNVAASRARDQMWLFHSVKLDDLKPDDLRYKLLLHCKLPPDVQDYSLDAELMKCESKFERDVAQRIAGRGLRVFAQVKVAGYRIDLVVEGADGKQLAVECDGDHWHGPERFDADMQRQRVLERCGWKFWRVWGSEFYESPEDALRSLWALLEAQGIAPASPVAG